MLRALVGFLVFVALTVESDETFAFGRWHTVMAMARPLFEFKLPGVGLGLWDLALAGAVLVVAVRPHTWKGRVAALDLVLLSSLLAIVSWTVFGVIRGGDPRQALTQLNALLRMFILFFVIHAVFRTPRDARRLTWVILAAAAYRAVACLVFFFFFVRGQGLDPYPETMTDHHDSALWATAAIGLVGWILASRRWRSAGFASAAALLILLLLAIRYNDRRIAWIELVGGLGLLYVGMAAGRLRKAVHRRAVVALPLLTLYVVAGWGRTETVFLPVQQLKSSLTDTTDPSNDARELENRGLVVTLQTRKLLGTGFGHEFIEVSDLYSLGMSRRFPNYRYLPHNSLVGLLAFTGAVGFSIIWTFLPASAFLAARAYSRSRSPWEAALSLTAFAVPFVYSAQAFGDMGLQSLKANVILAASIAIAARLAVDTGAWHSPPRRRRSLPAAGIVAPPDPAVAG